MCATTCWVLPVRWHMLGAWPTFAGTCYALVMHLALDASPHGALLGLVQGVQQVWRIRHPLESAFE